jgi:hypothetical protein
MVDINPSLKFALVIGINYKGTQAQLQGCINDANNMVQYLVTQRGYLRNNITLITDDTFNKPNASAVKTLINSLVYRAYTNNAKELWLHYSGHGTYIRDTNGDEKDGRDECIVPLDYRTRGFIIDDYLNQLVGLLPATCRMIALFDSCFSGTVLDLKYIVDLNNNNRIENTRRKISGKIYCISGSDDTQPSADAWLNGKWAGAMTTSFLACATPGISFLDLARNMRTFLTDQGFTQTPRLTCTTTVSQADKF